MTRARARGDNIRRASKHGILVDDQDAQLIRNCLLTGDLSAYEALYYTHAGRVAAYLLRSGFSKSDADDLTQESFVRAFKSLTTFDPRKGEFRAWLAKIARNVARNQWSRRKHPELFDSELAEQTFVAPSNPGDTPEAREECAAVEDCVERIAEPLGQLVRLRYVEGRTLRGIAAATKMPEATVRLRLKEALDMIQRCLSEKGILK